VEVRLLSLSQYSCARWLLYLSFSIFVCTLQAAGIGGPAKTLRAFSALLPSATCTQASLFDGRATHGAPELPSVTGTASFNVLRRWLQGAGPRSRPDGSTMTASFSSTAAWVRAPPRKRRRGPTTVGLDLGPAGLDLGSYFFIFKN
jgi:hypothetical protein